MPDGDVATTWLGASGTVEARGAGPAGSQAVVSPAISSVTSQGAAIYSTSAELVVPQPPAGTSLTTIAEEYAASGPSVYWDAIGAGATPAVAAEMTEADGLSVPSAPGPTTTDVTPDGGTIYNSACITKYAGIDDLIQAEMCVVQSYLQQGPAIYVENQNTTSGISAISNEPLSALDGYYAWGPTGGTYNRVGWSPAATISEGTPTTYTLSASYGGFGASVQETQYPDTLWAHLPDRHAKRGLRFGMVRQQCGGLRRRQCRSHRQPHRTAEHIPLRGLQLLSPYAAACSSLTTTGCSKLLRITALMSPSLLGRAQRPLPCGGPLRLKRQV